MKNTLHFISGISFLILLASCGSPKEKNKEVNADKDTAIVYSETAPLNENGLKVYKNHCLACHLEDGSGVKGKYPPLVNNPVITGETSELVNIVLNGKSGETFVNGEKYNQVMIPHDFLSDKQIADVLTYIRNAFGNTKDIVKTPEVKAIRKKNALKK